MPLKVASQAQYLTRPAGEMRKADFNATHLVKAVKGLSLNPNAYTHVPIGGRSTRITEANKDRAMDWHAEWAAKQINALGNGPKVIIPVPSSKTTAESPATFRTALIAEKIAALCPNTKALPILRFKAERPNTRDEGGSRDADDLYEEMELTGKLPKDATIILVDDVITGGGHLKASAWVIEDEGQEVELALTCGRSVDTQLDDPFTVPAESIDLARCPF